ncbi:Nucleotidyltransferase family protein [Raphanus sativus]|nr:Nucleotidyltransferase family protein [Raphanus sativus]
MQFDIELWMVAEERAQEILNTIQPIIVSDRSRNEIVYYLQTLVKDRLGLEVFNFGSVPLKTYLPDGDIDLTVLTPQDKEEDLAKALCKMLEAEDGESDFDVTDVQYIQAQVKVIKCKIRNVAVDISFNQVAGLSALCFLEQVDQIFGRDHLFKRSIILVKAWCYYESRILGSNTGLISTYALAVLVLHIINISYASVSGPLAVLFKFLDYYASFDWGNNCVTVYGPVLISSLPDMKETEHHEVVLNEKFVRECMESYSFSTKAAEANGRYFPVRHFNIVDPLKHSNNLGRSVTQGNVQRLKHAFTLGARKIKDVLTLPGETMGWKLEKFFCNSLDRNGKGERLDVEEPVTAFGTGRSELSELRGDFEGYFQSLVYGKWFHGETQLWIPQGHDTNSWDNVNGQRSGFYWRRVDGATSLQNMRRSIGTGTFIPEMRQESYTNRSSSKPKTVKSLPSTSQS